MDEKGAAQLMEGIARLKDSEIITLSEARDALKDVCVIHWSKILDKEQNNNQDDTSNIYGILRDIVKASEKYPKMFTDKQLSDHINRAAGRIYDMAAEGMAG